MISSLISLIIASSISIDQSAFLQSENILLTHSTSSIPEKNSLMLEPIISSKSALVIDLESGSTLFEKNANKKLPIASITKLMTNYIILEENNLDEIVKVSSKAANTMGSTMGLFTGEEISVKNLIYGSLINSGNDASVALAEYNSGSVSAFVDKMNQKADELGLFNTRYQNPTGLDQNNHYSSAMDIAKLGQKIYKHELVKEAVKTKNIIITNSSGKSKHYLKNTNDLLDSYLNVKGLKTGKTPEAGECLAIITELEDGREILAIVIGSSNRFRDSKIIIDWTERAYFKDENNLITKK